MTRKILKQYYGILLGVLALLTHYLLQLVPYMWIDKIYTTVVYPIFKWTLAPLQWLPFPSLYLIIAIIIMYLLLGWFRNLQLPPLQLARKLLLQVFNIVGLLVFLFYSTWAFNYRGWDIQSRLQLPEVKANAQEFYTLYEEVTQQLIETRMKMPDQSSGTINEQEMSRHIDSLQRIWLQELGYPVRIPAKVKPLMSGILLRISTAGFYFPMGGEGYYDGGLHSLTVPFVIAHELAHNYGVMDEGEANFVAFHTCLQSKDPYIRYSALLDFWRYLAATYRRMDPDQFEVMRENVPETIWADLRSIRIQHEKYPDILPQIRDQIYALYLQSQGVEEGMASYARIIELELAYRKKYPSKR